MLDRGRHRRWPRLLGAALAALLVLALAAAFGVAWYFAGAAVAVSHAVVRPLVASPAPHGDVRITGGGDAGAGRG